MPGCETGLAWVFVPPNFISSIEIKVFLALKVVAPESGESAPELTVSVAIKLAGLLVAMSDLVENVLSRSVTAFSRAVIVSFRSERGLSDAMFVCNACMQCLDGGWGTGGGWGVGAQPSGMIVFHPLFVSVSLPLLCLKEM